METEIQRFDRILPRWYSEGVIMETNQIEYFDWVKQQTPDVWHAIICATTDADEATVSHWIVSHPDCDQGTAVNLFRLDAGNLDYPLSELSPDYHDQWRALKTCETRLLNDDFKTRELMPELPYNGLGLPSGDRYFTIPDQIRTFKGQRKADSKYTLSGGNLMLTLDAFCEFIGEPKLNV